MPRKKQVETEISQELKDILDATPMVEDLKPTGGSAAQAPTVGDIIQVTAENHICFAFIGIVHSISSGLLVCYQPDRGRPRKFTTDLNAALVVGKARLKWSKPLPDDSTNDRSYLDKV